MATSVMSQSEIHSEETRRQPCASTAMVGKLLDLLLTDAMRDIEVAARELRIRDEMRERLRRSLDRLTCAQSVAEALHDGLACEEELPMDPVARAMKTLACAWTRDYCADALERILLDER